MSVGDVSGFYQNYPPELVVCLQEEAPPGAAQLGPSK